MAKRRKAVQAKTATSGAGNGSITNLTKELWQAAVTLQKPAISAGVDARLHTIAGEDCRQEACRQLPRLPCSLVAVSIDH
jgi:hypothetical protein